MVEKLVSSMAVQRVARRVAQWAVLMVAVMDSELVESRVSEAAASMAELTAHR